MGRLGNASRSALLLSDEEVERYHAEGFLRLDRPLISLGALDEAHKLLDRLFDRFDRLPPGYAKDLAEGSRAGEPPRIPEIVQTTQLKPRLLRSEAVAVCTSIARQLHGAGAHLVFDHAIYKPPHNEAETAWHQDAAYARPGELGVGVWVPLQGVGADGGCMRFVPGSHLKGLSEHAHLASGSNPDLLGTRVEDADVVTCPVRAGGVVLHNVFTLHSTGPNRSGATRRAWIMNFSYTAPVLGRLGRVRRRAGVLAELARYRAGRD